MQIKEKLIQIADCFYQERNAEGMNMFFEMAPQIGLVPQFKEYINLLFDAVEAEDYILAADILQHEMAEKL